MVRERERETDRKREGGKERGEAQMGTLKNKVTQADEYGTRTHECPKCIFFFPTHTNKCTHVQPRFSPGLAQLIS